MKRVRRQLTYANVMASIAVFIALAGGAYAATKLPKNSVGAKQIKPGAITGAKVKNGTLEEIKLTPTAVASLRGAKGDPGPEGARGAAGPSKVVAVAAAGPDGIPFTLPAVASSQGFSTSTVTDVLVTGSGEMRSNCPGPGGSECPTEATLYLDGDRMGNTQGLNLSNGAASFLQPISLSGVMHDVPPGDHVAELRFANALEDGGTSSINNSSISVIAVEP